MFKETKAEIVFALFMFDTFEEYLGMSSAAVTLFHILKQED